MWKKGDFLEVVRAFRAEGRTAPGFYEIGSIVKVEVDQELMGTVNICTLDDRHIGLHGGWGDGNFKLYTGKLPKGIKKPRPPALYPPLYAKAQALGIRGRSRMNIKQLEEAIKACKPTLEAELRQKVGKVSGECSYAIEFENGIRRFQIRDVCHARIPVGRNYHDEEKGLKVVKLALDVNAHYEAKGEEKETYLSFLHYMLNESPWAACFATKDVKKALTSAVLMDVSKPISQLACAAIALRQVSEYPRKLTWWKDFKDMGLSSNEAWFATQGITGTLAKPNLSAIGGGHDVFVSYMSFKDVLKFFREGFHLASEPYPYSEGNSQHNRNQSYSIFRSIARDVKEMEKSLSSFFKDNCPQKIVGEGWVVETAIPKESLALLVKKIKEIFK